MGPNNSDAREITKEEHPFGRRSFIHRSVHNPVLPGV